MNEPDNKLFAALRRILRPVVRVAISKSISLPALIDLLKQLYVETAQEYLEREGKKTTDSHISVMTGVHRKDVKAYRARQSSNEPSSPRLSTGAELIATWLAKPDYIDAEGKPLTIPYLDKDPAAKSFSALAAEISKDVRPRALLDDLVRLGAAEENPVTGLVTLRADAFIPRENWEEKLHYFGQNSGDHLEAAVANTLSEKPPFMDRSVYHDGLTSGDIDELHRLSVEAGMKMLRQINRKAFELSEKNRDSQEATHRINLGTFFFSKNTKDEKNNE
jgi:hypothetical protein